ncbi:MAG: NAD(P)H-dependent oxidoreductase [Paramuribaculum sp.]|nr:NAD(P)H-dependent oxidoreductase [Paramuribaculum sp.]
MFKVIKTIILLICSLLGFTACASNAKQENKETADQTTKEVNMNGKQLVVYFSHTGENYNVGYIKKGNTAIIADMIADATGADKFEIVPVKDYPDDYNQCIEVAQQEKRANARPAIKGDKDIANYDVIFIGYPNWWGEVPMCVYTFIEKHNWQGKTVIPFITHEGSGMSGTDRKIANAAKGSNTLVGKGLAVQGKVAQENRTAAKKSVDNWLSRLGYN